MSYFRKILVLTLEEVRDELALHLAETFLKNQNTVEKIKVDILSGSLPNLKTMADTDVLYRFLDLKAGKRLGEFYKVDQIQVYRGSNPGTPDYHTVVWDCLQHMPENERRFAKDALNSSRQKEMIRTESILSPHSIEAQANKNLNVSNHMSFHDTFR